MEGIPPVRGRLLPDQHAGGFDTLIAADRRGTPIALIPCVSESAAADGEGSRRIPARRRGRVRIGTSGYQYDHWRGVLYPEGLPKREWLAHYAAHFDTVEINNTFHHLPEASTFDGWLDAVEPGFCFALKFSRYGSHLKHLADAEGPIDAFLERARRLGDALGPVLVQLPPRWSPDVERLARFLRAAPCPPRWAVELRDPRWLCDDVYSVLREHEAALCIHDLIEDHPFEVTAPFVYLRYHGAETHDEGYSHQRLTAHARRIASQCCERGLDVYAYFNNDVGGHAVRNATDLRRYVENALARRRDSGSSRSGG